MAVKKKTRSLLATVHHIFHPQRSNNHRPRLLHPEALLVLLMVAVVGYGGISLFSQTRLGSVLGYASSITPTKVVSLTNQQRATAGLPALTTNPQLNQAALAKAQHMFSNQYWAHNSPDGTTPWIFIRNAGYSYRAAGENLARDFAHTEEMVSAWMASPTHRDNIMSGRYSQIGVAVVDGTLQGVETTLVVQMFGDPSVAVAQVPEQPAVEEEPAPVQNPATVATEPVEVVSAPDTEPAVEVVSRQPVAEEETTIAGLQTLLPAGEIETPPLLSPLHLIKAFFVALILVIVFTLIYDTVIIANRNTVRLVGKNMAHVMLLMTVLFLIIFFQGGAII